MNSDTKKPFDLTADDIMSLKPCRDYDKELVAALCQQASTDGPEKVLLSLPINDARWIVVRLLGPDQRMEWAAACAERARGYATSATSSAASRAAAYAAAQAADACAASAAEVYAAYAAEYANYAADAAAKTAAANYAAQAAACADAAAKAVSAIEEHQTAIRHALSLLGY